MTLQEFLSYYKLNRVEPHDNGVIYRWHTCQDGYAWQPPNGYMSIPAWDNSPYRFVCLEFHHQDLAIITYCEGDIDVTVCSDMDHYLNELHRTNDFYNEKRSDDSQLTLEDVLIEAGFDFPPDERSAE